MGRIGTAVKVVLVGLLVGAILLAGTVAAVFISHPRNEAAYLRQLHSYGDRYYLRKHPTSDAELLATGDRACTWLKHRQPALWRYGRDHELISLNGVYLKSLGAEERRLPGYVVASAWQHLCPAVKELVGPHRFWPWQQRD